MLIAAQVFHTGGLPMSKRYLGIVCAAAALGFGVSGAFAAPVACSLLTTAQVTAALGASASGGTGMMANLCMWTAPANGGPAQKVALTIGDARKFAMAKMPVNDSRVTKTPVSGVGDEAVFGTTAGQMASINVKKGDTYFAISLNGVPMDKAQAVATGLAKDVLSKL
jgi:hypothetical protein